MSSTLVEILRNVIETRFLISLYQDLDSFELLAHGIPAARKEVHGQVGTYLAKTGRIRESVRSREERCAGCGLKGCEAQRIVYEFIDNHAIAAQPVERSPRRLERSVHNVLSRKR